MRALVPDSWREYRRRNRMALMIVLGGLCGLFGVALLVILLNIPGGGWVLVGALLLWLFICGRSAFRVVRWPCPRCGVPWLSSQPPEFTRHRKCGKCGLGLYEAT